MIVVLQSSTVWKTVLRSDKQALCEVQVFFFSLLFWYFIFACDSFEERNKIWSTERTGNKRKAYIITNNARDFWWTKFTIFFPCVVFLFLSLVFYNSYSIWLFLPLANSISCCMSIFQLCQFAIWRAPVYILCIHSWKCAHIN